MITRIRTRKAASTTGGGGGGSGLPTFIINETEQHSDTLVLNPTLNETEQHSETVVLNPTLNDAIDRLDAFLLPTMSFTSNDTEQRSELTTVGPITLFTQMRNIVIDSSSNAHNNGTYTGTVTKVAGDSAFATGIATSDGNFVSLPTHADYDFNITNWTVDVKIKTSSSSSCFFGVFDVTSSAVQQWVIGTSVAAPAGRAAFAYINSGGTQVNMFSSATFNDGAWHTLRLTKSGTALTLLVDGSSVATATSSGIQAMPATALTIGDLPGTFTAGAANWDEIRISNVARADSISVPFVNDANTKILLHFDEPISTSFDTDEWGDAWTDNTVGQTGTNHGATVTLAMAVGVAGVGVNLAWVELNMKRFTGLTATGNAHTFTCVATNGSALLASTITLKMGPSAISSGAARGFTESTITQANQPATPSSFTATANLAAGASNATLTFTLTDAAINAVIGKWVTIQFSSSGGTVATPDSIVSREGSVANRMSLTFTGQV